MEGMKKIAEGWHSEIFLTDKGTIIKKFKKGLEKNFEKELYFLQKLKDFDFVPKLVSYDKDKLEIEMEYIKGETLEEFIKKSDKEKIKEILLKIIDICYILDKMKIQKEEMHRPQNHIFILGDKIILIDWERAHEKDNPSNLTQFLQFIIRSKELKEKGIDVSLSNLLELMKEYKRTYSEETLKKIKEILRSL